MANRFARLTRLSVFQKGENATTENMHKHAIAGLGLSSIALYAALFALYAMTYNTIFKALTPAEQVVYKSQQNAYYILGMVIIAISLLFQIIAGSIGAALPDFRKVSAAPNKVIVMRNKMQNVSGAAALGFVAALLLVVPLCLLVALYSAATNAIDNDDPVNAEARKKALSSSIGGYFIGAIAVLVIAAGFGVAVGGVGVNLDNVLLWSAIMKRSV